jgi:hypothetical protein
LAAVRDELKLTLTLLVARILAADDAHDTLAPNDLAPFTDALD